MPKILAYLDQNVLGYLRDGALDFSEIHEVEWVYSNEHFNEVQRSSDTSILKPLESLRARQLELVLDEKWRITDKATVLEYLSPFERYQKHLTTISEIPINLRLFTIPLARIRGADNYQDLLMMPDLLESEILGLLTKAGVEEGAITQSVAALSEGLRNCFKDFLSETRSLESLRDGIGTSKGRGGTANAENALQEIWKIVAKKAPGLSADRFFGFDPIDKQGYESWPLYLGIIGCYELLNIVGYRTDRDIASESAAMNIASDAAHVAHAAFCDVLISEDRRLCDKARAIYSYKNIGTHVIQLQAKRHS